MQVSRSSLPVQQQELMQVPEKVLQFGTGVLLRALPDYFIDKANKQGLFNGRVVVVKSTDGDGSAFERQDNLYTICVRGIHDGAMVEEDILSTAISRVLSARTEWPAVLACARNPEISIIISNTTEVGIRLIDDDIHASPPASFPGKLLAFLRERWRHFDGDPSTGCTIIPTELIDHNGDELKRVVLALAEACRVEPACIAWIRDHQRFCNSLVDRIVPGKPAPAIRSALEERLGYSDELLTMAEVFRLWAIEGDASVKAKLGFHAADPGLVITEDIELFKELKLRLLNGTHTMCCGPAFHYGFSITRDATVDEVFGQFMRRLMLEEIAVSIPCKIPADQVNAYAEQVRERFANPYIDHPWISITLQYSSKIRMRNLPLLQQWYRQHSEPPLMMATGFAAYIYFTKPVKEDNGLYYGMRNGEAYPIRDDRAALFLRWWQELPTDALVQTVLGNNQLWGADLNLLPGFGTAVTQILKGMLSQGMVATIQHMIKR